MMQSFYEGVSSCLPSHISVKCHAVSVDQSVQTHAVQPKFVQTHRTLVTF